MGKTSVAQHVLHHRDVVALFDSRRYFIRCDAITTADTLARSIMQHLHISFLSKDNPIDALTRALVSAPQTLLVLDNFETPWDGEATRSEIKNVLAILGNSKTASLIITMRGAHPPEAIAWTLRVPLSVLDPSAACRVFLTINPVKDIGNSDKEVLDSLLRDLEYIPLAITLLATVGQGFPLKTLHKMWSEERTSLLAVRNSKLESLDVSIHFSLTTFYISETPKTVQLLGVLCLLPDGLSDWQKKLTSIAPSLENASRLARLLVSAALVQLEGDRLRVLSPIRHYILRNHPADDLYVEETKNYFWDLISHHTEASFNLPPHFLDSQKILNPELGNINSIIHYAFRTRPSPESIDAALSMSTFYYFTAPSIHLLEEAKVILLQIKSPQRSARCSQILGNVLGMRAKYEEAYTELAEATRIYKEIGEHQDAADSLRGQGEILRMQSKYEQASTILSEARKLSIEIGHSLGAARCSRSLGDILRMQSQYPEALVVLTEAKEEFVAIEDPLGSAQCSLRLGNVLRMQSKYDEAWKTISNARREFKKIGNPPGVNQCLQSLGDTLRMQSKYEKAWAFLTKARKESIESGERLCALQCLKSLGDILLLQYKYEDAVVTLTKAKGESVEIGSRLEEANCLRSLGMLYLIQKRNSDAMGSLTEARDVFLSIGHSIDAAWCASKLEKISGPDIYHVDDVIWHSEVQMF